MTAQDMTRWADFLRTKYGIAWPVDEADDSDDT